MGTNYYAHRSSCPHCGRGDNALHIGKSSAGWTFSFQADPIGWDEQQINSWEQWQEVLSAEGVTIHDEYDSVITLVTLRAIVHGKRDEKNHTTYMRTEYTYPGASPRALAELRNGVFLDAEGHSFSWGDFS